MDFNHHLQRPPTEGSSCVGDPKDNLSAVDRRFNGTLTDLRRSIRVDLGAQPSLGVSAPERY